MSLLRTAVARSTAASCRRYSTAPNAAKSSNLGFYLIGAGAVGLGAYTYLYNAGPAALPKKIQEKSPLDPQNFVDFELKKVEHYNHNTSKFIFKLNDDEASLLPVTSCVVIKSADPEALVDKKGKPIIRPYTPISAAGATGELTFLVKKYDDGNASKHFHELKPGEKLSIKGPIPKFPYKDNEFEEVGMIAGGSGITPMYQIITHALSQPSNKTKLKLIFSNTSEQDILLREEFDALKKKYPDTFDVIYTVDKPSSDWKGPSGYVNADLVKAHFSGPALGDKLKIFVCGPPGQMKAISGGKVKMDQGPLDGILKELGYNESQVYKF